MGGNGNRDGEMGDMDGKIGGQGWKTCKNY